MQQSLVAIQEVSAQSIFDKWVELKAFHGVMSQTFHPSEEGNLELIKTRSEEMAEKAKKNGKICNFGRFQNGENPRCYQKNAKKECGTRQISKKQK